MSTRYRKVHVSLSSLSMLSSKLLGFPQHSRLPPSFSKVLLPTTWLRICQASHLHARLQYGFCPSLLHCLPLGSCWGFSLSARVFFSFKLWQNCAWPSTFWFSFNLLCIVFCLHSSLHVSRRHHILLQRVRPTTWLLGIELWTPRKTVLLTFEPSLQPPSPLFYTTGDPSHVPQHMPHGTRSTTNAPRHMLHSTYSSAHAPPEHGSQHMLHSTPFTAHAPRHTLHGTRPTAHAPQHMVHSTRSMAHAP